MMASRAAAASRTTLVTFACFLAAPAALRGDAGGLPDLAPGRVEAESVVPACPPDGIFFCVENRGTARAGEFQVLLRVIDGGSSVAVLPGIEAGAESCVGLEAFPESAGFADGGLLEIRVDAMDEVAESDESNNVGAFTIPFPPPPDAGCTPTPTPSGSLALEPESLTLVCDGSFDVRVVNTSAAGEAIVVDAVSFREGYSQGFYGYGFDWDLDQIELPGELASGDALVVPIEYSAADQDFPTRLHVHVDGTASNGGVLYADGVYLGLLCETRTPEPTATPTPTPTPRATGDLGFGEFGGIVYDASLETGAPIEGALVTYVQASLLPGRNVRGSLYTDQRGRYSFTLFLHDTDQLTLRVDAAGFRTFETSGSAIGFPVRRDVGLAPVSTASDGASAEGGGGDGCAVETGRRPGGGWLVPVFLLGFLLLRRRGGAHE